MYANLFKYHMMNFLGLISVSEEIQKNMCDENSTIKEILKQSPDALQYLFDKCLIKPIPCQFQGTVFFDFFLFKPTKGGKIIFFLLMNNIDLKILANFEQ